MIVRLLSALARGLLHLRYRLQLDGLEQIAAQGRGGILFLPNHPALIDPFIIWSELSRYFRMSALADKDQMDRPILRSIAPYAGVRMIPDPLKYGKACQAEVARVLADCVTGLKLGENFLLYPAGHIKHQAREDLGGNSAVEFILQNMPEVRVVLIRTYGLWGSRFGFGAEGRPPHVGRALGQGILAILANGIFFGPRRRVAIELAEPADLPRSAQRNTLNRYLEAFYNRDIQANTYVPYTIWERGGPRPMPEPATLNVYTAGELIPPATAEIVLKHLRDLSGKQSLAPEETLAGDLGLDSLARVELALWVEQEFGFPAGEDSLVTVDDVLCAACGQLISAGPLELKSVPTGWFDAHRVPVMLPEGRTLTEVFLAQARRGPNRVAVADQSSGVKTYRDMLTAILVLKPEIERLEGRYIGIMLPASAGAAILYFAALFSGKIPVMINWTIGVRALTHAVQLLKVRHILTARTLVQKLEMQGDEFGAIEDRFLYLESWRKTFPWYRKLAAALRSRTSWATLDAVHVPETAVVLFTSGSESLPKAVPLTHTNLLANMRDCLSVIRLRESDRFLGILPPFHSFGINVTMAFPLCAGIPMVYHPMPTEGGLLARLIKAYQVTVLAGTPTFLNGILRAAGGNTLETLRIVISGAEKCPAAVYTALAQKAPGAIIWEGYGITECSPVVSINDGHAPGTIGNVLPSLHHAIVHPETDRRVAPGQVGLLLLRGPSIFGDYLNYEGPSPFVEMEGKSWYRTGDLVSEDTGGVLTFAGRLKRFVKLGGEMISLPAIEDVLFRNFADDAAEGPVLAVDATPSDTAPELVLFTVKPIARETANKALRAAGLSPLHNIRDVRVVEAIPTLGTGKTDYRALKKMLAG
ncbi:MAG: AMP-binding protein [Verrucomicrobia bacterium]|nr:AMP-binding protein [Verrucomicrobiota bacterium]MBU1734423.1 AMP-binding protein [Verrucomicrobiota bacterium]MBU1857329.1 AMP-binding protein [Verrucomicrobiota bacterium]